jgi:hypothetical protein
MKAKSTLSDKTRRRSVKQRGALVRAIAALVSAAGFLSAAIIGPAFAEQPVSPLKIGLITDFSSVYSHIGGIGDLEAAKMAIEDFGGVMFGKPIELVSADALNKPDVAASIARKWWETRRRHDRRPADLLHSTRGDGGIEAKREDHDRYRCGEFRHHRKILLALYRALDL